jgi:hypothetical protein
MRSSLPGAPPYTGFKGEIEVRDGDVSHSIVFFLTGSSVTIDPDHSRVTVEIETDANSAAVFSSLDVSGRPRPCTGARTGRNSFADYAQARNLQCRIYNAAKKTTKLNTQRPARRNLC